MKALDWLMERFSKIWEEKPLPLKDYSKVDTGMTNEDWDDMYRALREVSETEEGRRFDQFFLDTNPKKTAC